MLDLGFIKLQFQLNPCASWTSVPPSVNQVGFTSLTRSKTFNVTFRLLVTHFESRSWTRRSKAHRTYQSQL